MKGSAPSEEYKRYSICRMMGWDFYTYENQPASFIQELSIFIRQENEEVKNSTSKEEQEYVPPKVEDRKVQIYRLDR